MGYFHIRYDSRVVNYDRRAFIRLAAGLLFVSVHKNNKIFYCLVKSNPVNLEISCKIILPSGAPRDTLTAPIRNFFSGFLVANWKC